LQKGKVFEQSGMIIGYKKGRRRKWKNWTRVKEKGKGCNGGARINS